MIHTGNIKKNSTSIHEGLRIVTDFLIIYSKLLINAGADVIAIIEYSGSSPIVGLEYFKAFVQPYLQEVIDEVRIPNILHIPGSIEISGSALKELLTSNRSTSFCLEWGVDIKNTRKILGNEVF